MCQSKKDGGKRCSVHQPAYIGTRQLLESTMDLDPMQIKHAYNVLRVQGKDHPTPTLEEYKEFISKQKKRIPDTLDTRTSQRIKGQLGKKVTTDQLPDGATFYAMTHLYDQGKAQRDKINESLLHIAQNSDKPFEEIQAQFKDELHQVVQTRKQSRRGLLDDSTKRVLESMKNKTVPVKEEVPRIQLEPVTARTRAIQEAGYDPEDGRLEVVINNNKYAFHSVTPDEWNNFQRRPMQSFTALEHDDSKLYRNAEEAENDAYRVWCQKCKRFRLASGHVCPASNNLESKYLSLRKEIEQSDQPNVRFPKWYRAWEKRNKFELKRNPSPDEVRAIAQNGDIAEFDLAFRTKEGDKVSGTFRAGQATPRDITLQKINGPKCTCEEYREKYECIHTRGGGFQRSVQRYYNKLDEESSHRNPTMEFPYGAYLNSQKFIFSAPDSGPDDKMLNDMAFVLGRGHKALIYLNNKIVKGNGEALGAFTYELRGSDVEAIEQASCTICNRYDCEHITGLSKRIGDKIQGKLLSPSYRLEQLAHTDYENENANRSQDMVNNAARTTKRYSDDIGSYISDVREAEAKIRRGESPLEFKAASVCNGNISTVPGEGRGFGVEIEYVVDNERQREAIQDAIASELVTAGLSNESYGFPYGRSSEFTHYQKWAVEDDSSVSGEVISPIMYDTPEHWEQLAKVCDIIKRHGGKVDELCGQHVHVGLEGAKAVSTNVGVMRFMQANQDSIRRAGTNPERGTHRNNVYSLPFQGDDAANVVYSLRQREYEHIERESMVNFRNDGHLEFRDADGTLDPAHIQAQVMISSAIVAAAEQGKLDRFEDSSVKTQRVGMNRKRTQLITGGKLKRLSDDELAVSDIAYRQTIDALFDDEHGKKTMVALGALNPWQKSLYEV